MRTSFVSTVVIIGTVLGITLLGLPITLSPLSAQDGGSIKNTATLKGHAEAVTSVAFSPDGKTLASGSHDKTVKLWDVSSGKDTATLKGHPGFVTFVAFTPSGKTLASAATFSESDHGTVKLWEVESGRNTATISPGLLMSVALSPDGNALATGLYKEIKFWDVPSGKNTATLKGHTKTVVSVRFSPDGKNLASVGEKGIKLWDLKSGKNVPLFPGYGPLAFSPDGKTIASFGPGGLSLRNTSSNEVTATLLGHTDNVLSLDFSADGKRLASGSSDQNVILWDVASAKSIAILKGHTSSVNSVAFSPDSKMLASASGDKTIKLWDISGEAGKKEPQPLPEPDAKEAKPRATLGAGHSGHVTCAAYSPDGKLMASSGFKEKVIKLWEVSSGRHVGTLVGHNEGINQLTFNPNSNVLASASADKTIKLWDVIDKKELATLSGHTGGVSSVSFSPNGKLLASGSGDTTARLWDVEEKKELPTYTKHKFGVAGVCFSPDGETVASCGWDKVILLDVKTGKEKGSLSGKDCIFNCVAFSPDGTILAAGTTELSIAF